MSVFKTIAVFLICQQLFIVSFSQQKENKEFEKSKGKLPFPVCAVYGFNDARCESSDWISPAHVSISFITDSRADIKAIHSGTVSKIFSVEEGYAIVINFGDYYITYYPLNFPLLKKGDPVFDGQPISSLSSSADTAEINILISKATTFVDPYKWFKW